MIACYARYVAKAAVAEAEAFPPKILVSRRHWRPLRRHVEQISLVNVAVLFPEHIFQESWQTTQQVNVGSAQTIETRTESVHSFSIDEESQSKIASSLGSKLSVGKKDAAVAELSASLQDEISQRIATKFGQQFTVAQTTAVNYELPSEPADPDAKFVRSRLFQRAPVFVKFRATLSRACSCCQASNYFVVIGYSYRNLSLTRTVDYYSDGEQRVTLTGLIPSTST